MPTTSDSPPASIHRGEFYIVRVKNKSYWESIGCSHWGRETKRDGKRVVCGHEHKTESAARKCQVKMQREKPGNCQSYTTRQRVLQICMYKKKRKATGSQP